MSVFQQYYTSYSNKATGSTGFQIKATSPGISPRMQGMIMRLIAYSIPPLLDVHALETHPVALRYYYQGRGECIFLCSQSTGNDDSGRPGNFFTHTLVLEPDGFSVVPPIFYWNSPFWRKEDPEKRLQLESLPVIPVFAEEPALDLEKMWSFIGQGQRRDFLYKLLCAVVHSEKTQRRIIILDSVENTVYWIALLSMLLPPICRPFLTFATYHHDPYQGHFLITGLTHASSFQSSARDHRAFFILDASTGTTSQVQDSSYAKMVAANARYDLYDTHLLPLFAQCTSSLSNNPIIDERLDQFVGK